MADPVVQRYLNTAENTNREVNTAIVDVAAMDYVSTLTPLEREDAEEEVAFIAWSTDWPDWERRMLLVQALRELRHRCRALENDVATLTARLGEAG